MCEVGDVDEVPQLPSVAVDAQRLTTQSPPEERRQNRCVPHAGPVRDAVAQDGERPLVKGQVVPAGHLRRDLRGHVEMAVRVGVEGRGLVDPLASRGSVDPHRAGQDDAAGAGLSRGFEDVHRSDDVDLGGASRLRDHVVDVGHRGQVEDGTAPVDRLGEGVEVEHVDGEPLDVVAVGGRGSMMRTRRPAATRASTTLAPMKPEPPVTVAGRRSVMRASLGAPRGPAAPARA